MKTISEGRLLFPAMLSKICFFLLPLLPAVAFGSQRNRVSDSDLDCVYTVYVRTSTIWKGGTDSIVNLTLFDSSGESFPIGDLEQWGGLMGSDWNYFERGNLDIFSGRGACLDSPPCKIVLGMDGSGDHPGWYCNYVEVTSTGLHSGCAQQKFTVEQWLGPDVISPQLSVTVDLCSTTANPLSNRIDSAAEVV
eukprot:TRINITY_DN7688_c0_g1_i1.p1 TRINITY_DN7688_c0_g1~~TRINITY_DN7688_c0_g1_i1.p1  ORF type:complete len:193 (+),score=0.99 TRINITY_DN7688_c0_g1_i1:48-626(+)